MAKNERKLKKDKLIFFTLLFIGLVLSIFNLSEMTGPTAWIETIFKPFVQFMEMWM